MTLVVGNKVVQSIVPRYDNAGVLTAIFVKVNRDIVDNATVPPPFKYGLGVSKEGNIRPQHTPTQVTAVRAFMDRLATLMSTMTEFEE